MEVKIMKYIEAPEIYRVGKLSIFLAGGITNCPDWQSEMVELLKDLDVVIYNPRRKNFPIGDKNEAYKQIHWEFTELDRADLILFWFSRGSLNPIVLFEYGKWLMNTRNNMGYKPLFIGIDPEYERRQDVMIQTELENGFYYNRICFSLEDLAKQIIGEIQSRLQ
jgi:hypothetical protein